MHPGRDPDLDAIAEPIADSVSDAAPHPDAGSNADARRHAGADTRALAAAQRPLEFRDGRPVAPLLASTGSRGAHPRMVGQVLAD